MTAALIGSALLVAIVGGALTPAVAWLDRRQRARVTGELASRRPNGLGCVLDDLLAPFADATRWLARGDRLDPGVAPMGARLAPAVSWLAAWMVFAVIPFGGHYRIVHEPIALIAADPTWGLLMVVLAPALAMLGTALAGISGAHTESLLGGVRATTGGMAALLALTASLLPTWVMYGTLQPTAVGVWQDGVIPFARVSAAFGATPPGWLPAGAGLPAWGGLLNPPAFILFVVASMMVVGRPPFDAARGRDLSGGVAFELSGARRTLFSAAAHVWTLAFACLAALLFLGGWSIPWIAQATLVDWIAPVLGAGFANAVCAAAHVVCFIVKVGVMVWLSLWLRWSLPGMRDDQVRSLCLRGIVPLALIDAFVTAAVWVAWGGTPT